MGSISIADTLRTLSDDKSLAIFNTVALTLPRDTSIAMNWLGITKKQYYSRLNRLIKAGLIMRKDGKYFLSSLGKAVYQSHMLIGHALENYWKLKAIDTIEVSHPDGDLPLEEKRRIIDALIGSNDIKSILLNQNIPSYKNHKFSDSIILTTSDLTIIEK